MKQEAFLAVAQASKRKVDVTINHVMYITFQLLKMNVRLKRTSFGYLFVFIYIAAAFAFCINCLYQMNALLYLAC